MNMMFDIITCIYYIFMYICLKIYLYKLEIRLYKFVNRFIWYQIIICSLLIIQIAMVKILVMRLLYRKKKRLIKYLANKFELFRQKKNQI